MLLGFNDLGWFVSDPQGTIYSMNDLVDNARLGKRDVKFCVGNVVQRLYIEGRDDLVENTLTYNQMLYDAVATWDEDYLTSPVAYVDVASNYDCTPELCNDGYDGLHPTEMGEYHIAQAFANSMRDYYGFVGQDLAVPATANDRPLGVPTGFSGVAVPEGVYFNWAEYFGFRGYDIRLRINGEDGWWSDGAVYPVTNGNYFTWCQAGRSLS